MEFAGNVEEWGLCQAASGGNYFHIFRVMCSLFRCFDLFNNEQVKMMKQNGPNRTLYLRDGSQSGQD